jgi:hypothetical protein
MVTQNYHAERFPYWTAIVPIIAFLFAELIQYSLCLSLQNHPNELHWVFVRLTFFNGVGLLIIPYSIWFYVYRRWYRIINEMKQNE